jgi:hypothetical protein
MAVCSAPCRTLANSQELPKSKHKQPEWEIAAESLLEAVEGKGPLMFAEIAMRKALNAGKPDPKARR